MTSLRPLLAVLAAAVAVSVVVGLGSQMRLRGQFTLICPPGQEQHMESTSAGWSYTCVPAFPGCQNAAGEYIFPIPPGCPDVSYLNNCMDGQQQTPESPCCPPEAKETKTTYGIMCECPAGTTWKDRQCVQECGPILIDDGSFLGWNISTDTPHPDGARPMPKPGPGCTCPAGMSGGIEHHIFTQGTSLYCCPNGSTWDHTRIDGKHCVPASDRDKDGIPDATDNCPDTPNFDQWDSDANGLGDACDCESETPLFPFGADLQPAVKAPCKLCNPRDVDRDGVYNDFKPEKGDLEKGTDNCPEASNHDQSDLDKDGVGDACDDDIDADNCKNPIATPKKDTAGCFVSDYVSPHGGEDPNPTHYPIRIIDDGTCKDEEHRVTYTDAAGNVVQTDTFAGGGRPSLEPATEDWDFDKDDIGNDCDACPYVPGAHDPTLDADEDGTPDCFDPCPGIPFAHRAPTYEFDHTTGCSKEAPVDPNISYDENRCPLRRIPKTPECSDGIDNDKNGLTDREDPGCHTDGDADNEKTYSATDNVETFNPPECGDDIDNDKDGLTDKDDPGCHVRGMLHLKYDKNLTEKHEPVCGNGVVDAAGEECDAGIANNNESACTVKCKKAACGDGFRRTDLAFGQRGFEQCDNGEKNGDTKPCNTRCERRCAGSPPKDCRSGPPKCCFARDSEAWVCPESITVNRADYCFTQSASDTNGPIQPPKDQPKPPAKENPVEGQGGGQDKPAAPGEDPSMKDDPNAPKPKPNDPVPPENAGDAAGQPATGPGELCPDLDHCADNPCDEGRKCTSLAGKEAKPNGACYECGECKQEYVEQEDGSCKKRPECPADECAGKCTSPGLQCTRFPHPIAGLGCHECSCNAAKAIDECTTKNLCGNWPNSVCAAVKDAGSCYACACKAGYKDIDRTKPGCEKVACIPAVDCTGKCGGFAVNAEPTCRETPNASGKCQTCDCVQGYEREKEEDQCVSVCGVNNKLFCLAVGGWHCCTSTRQWRCGEPVGGCPGGNFVDPDEVPNNPPVVAHTSNPENDGSQLACCPGICAPIAQQHGSTLTASLASSCTFCACDATGTPVYTPGGSTAESADGTDGAEVVISNDAYLAAANVDLDGDGVITLDEVFVAQAMGIAVDAELERFLTDLDAQAAATAGETGTDAYTTTGGAEDDALMEANHEAAGDEGVPAYISSLVGILAAAGMAAVAAWIMSLFFAAKPSEDA